MIHGKGGLTAYLGTNDMIAISRWAEDGEEPARTVLDAMLYTVAKLNQFKELVKHAVVDRNKRKELER